jgi:uncharacterized membrane protein
MAEILDLQAYREKKAKEEVAQLAEELNEIIATLNIDTSPKPYYVPYDEMYTMSAYTYQVGNPITSISEVTDALTGAMLALDSLGKKKLADKIGDVLGVIFES